MDENMYEILRTSPDEKMLPGTEPYVRHVRQSKIAAQKVSFTAESLDKITKRIINERDEALKINGLIFLGIINRTNPGLMSEAALDLAASASLDLRLQGVDFELRL